ncbi:MAG: hypothetical protein LBD72_00565 [Puniceicoccales bacterium]|nr:hypothetical protein [Puniceicoccales bacterium]
MCGRTHADCYVVNPSKLNLLVSTPEEVEAKAQQTTDLLQIGQFTLRADTDVSARITDFVQFQNPNLAA